MYCNTCTDLAIDEENDSALAGSTDFIAGVPTGMDHIFSQISQSLEQANVQAGVINNVIDELQKNLIVIGEVVSIQTLSESGMQIVHVSAIKGKAFLSFKFPSPNKSDGILSEFQRAQNHGFIVRVTYIIREKQNYIKSVEVIPRWTLGKK
jgi:hypothetical protein